MAGRDLETLIASHFEGLAQGTMFPLEIAANAFELEAVLRWLGDPRGRLILDAGCAKGRFVRALSDMGARAVGTDPVWGFIRAASQNVPHRPFVVSTVTRLPFADGTYYGVLCVEVLEHVPDLDAALAELARVLKPGGRAIIIDKNLLGIGYRLVYPNWIYKPAMERLGRWFYPRDFPFKERWYTSGSMKRRLQSHFPRVEVRYLDGRVKGRRRTLLAPLFKLLPAIRPDVAWCCEK